MNHLKLFNQLYEFNRKDKQLLLSSGINDNFTVAFEFELECDDPLVPENKSDREVLSAFRNDLIDILKNNIKIELYSKFIDETINAIDLDIDEDDVLDMLEPKKATKRMSEEQRTKQLILGHLYDIVAQYYEDREDEEDEPEPTDEFGNTIEWKGVEYLEEKVIENFPKFYKKYGTDCKYELDGSLRKGIEFSLKTYLTSLDEGIEMLNIFFEDYDKQKYFFMNENTSIHINLGLVDKNAKFNPLKGVIMVADISEKDTPFVFKDMTWRMNNRFCGAILPEIQNLKSDWSNIDLHDIESVEDFFVDKIKILIEAYGPKAFGVNLHRLFENGYVEFRYAGGVLNKDLMIDKLLYFAYIIHMMTTDYKEREYHKKLYKFVNDLKNA